MRQPRVNDRRVDEVTGERRRFLGDLAGVVAQEPALAEVLPLLYFCTACHPRISGRRWSSSSVSSRPGLVGGGDDHSADDAVARRGARVFNTRSLAEMVYVYCWVDGIHLKVRLEQDKVCLLVIIGVRADGR